MVNFIDLFRSLEQMGILDSLIPFILIFTIVFAALEKTQILGMGKRGMNTLVALAIGLMVVIPHIIGRYPAGSDPVEIMNRAIPNVSLVMVAVVMVLILAGVFGFQFVGGGLTGGVLIFAGIAVIYFFGQAAGIWNDIIPHIDSETRSLIIALLVFGLIIWFITKDDSKQTEAGGWLKGFSDSMKKL